MTTLVTADLHLSENPRDSYRFKGLDEITRIAKREKVDEIAILGDLTEQKDRHNAWLVNKICERVYDWSHICPVVLLKGNHDYIVEDSPFFAFLQLVEDVSYIGKPWLIGGAIWLPHTNNWQRDWKSVNIGSKSFASATRIFAHATFDGAQSEHGKTLSGIPTSIFQGAPKDFVISGDIHTPQRVGPVTYVGAPYLVDFGDDYKPRVLILDGSKTRSVPVPGPQKRLIEIDSVCKPMTNLMTPNEGDIVKIRVNLRGDEYAKWGELRGLIRGWAEDEGLQVHSIAPVVEASKTSSVKRRTAAGMSDVEVVQQFGKAQGLDDKTVQTGVKLTQEK